MWITLTKLSNAEFFPLYQKTPLHLAAGQGHIDVVKCLVDAGADIIAKDMDGVTYIYISAKYKNLPLL